MVSPLSDSSTKEKIKNTNDGENDKNTKIVEDKVCQIDSRDSETEFRRESENESNSKERHVRTTILLSKK